MQIASTNWTEYLCDFVELEKGTNSTDHIKMIKRGQYYKLSICVKLEILRGLVNWALLTDAIKGTLEVYISETKALVAAKREEDLEEVRKRREDKQLKEMTSDNNNSVQQNGVSECTSLHSFDSERSCEQTKDMQGDVNMDTPASNETHHLGIRYYGSTLLCVPSDMLTSINTCTQKILKYIYMHALMCPT